MTTVHEPPESAVEFFEGRSALAHRSGRTEPFFHPQARQTKASFTKLFRRAQHLLGEYIYHCYAARRQEIEYGAPKGAFSQTSFQLAPPSQLFHKSVTASTRTAAMAFSIVLAKTTFAEEEHPFVAEQRRRETLRAIKSVCKAA